LILEYSYTHEALSKQLGKSRVAISNTLRLRTLPHEIQEMVRKSIISMGHARALLAVDEDKRRIELANKIAAEGISVRAAEQWAQRKKQARTAQQKINSTEKHFNPDITEALNRLQFKFGTSVTLKSPDGQKGKIEIEYFSEKDLARIFDLLFKTT
jgi:ParB family transcriptional regulator, chromosome partitioning protein